MSRNFGQHSHTGPNGIVKDFDYDSGDEVTSLEVRVRLAQGPLPQKVATRPGLFARARQATARTLRLGG